MHGGWCGPEDTVEVGSFISLFTMGLVHSYQGFSKRMYETIIQLWLFLILSKTNPKEAFFLVWGLRMEIIMMPRYMQFSREALKLSRFYRYFGWWGSILSPKISKTPMVLMECRVVRK